MGEGAGRVGGVHELGLDAAAGQLGPHLVEAGQLLAGERMVWLVGDGQVGPQPLEHERPTAGDVAGQLDGRRRIGAHTVHAGVHLQVHRDAFAASGGGDSGHARGRVHGGREPPVDRLGHVGRIGLGEQQDGRVDGGVAQLHALLDGRHRQPGGAAVQHGAGDRHRAVAVAVGLDDRAQAGGSRPRRQRRRVVSDGGEIDLGPRRTHLRSR